VQELPKLGEMMWTMKYDKVRRFVSKMKEEQNIVEKLSKKL